MGVAHLQAAPLIQFRDQSLRICRIQAEEVPSPSAKAEEEGRKRSVVGCSAWGCSRRKRVKGCEQNMGTVIQQSLTVLAGNPGPLDKTRSGTTDKLLFGRVFVDMLDL